MHNVAHSMQSNILHCNAFTFGYYATIHRFYYGLPQYISIVPMWFWSVVVFFLSSFAFVTGVYIHDNHGGE